jgi:hypothetical protein
MTPRLLTLSALLTALLIVCGINYPAYLAALAGLIIVVGALVVLKLLWDCWRVNRSHNEEQNIS